MDTPSHSYFFSKTAPYQVSASSSYEPVLVGPANARLNSERGGGAWCPKSLIDKDSDNPEFLEIDLVKDHVIRNTVRISSDVHHLTSYRLGPEDLNL